MKRIIIAAILSGVAVSAKAQTTYQASNTPFVCDAATLARVPLSWSMFACRGLIYKDASGNQVADLFFWGSGRIEVFTPSWTMGPYTSSLSLTNFTPPDPEYCGVINQFCKSGVTPGAFSFTWSGTDANGVQHSGSVSGTWINQQVCGGRGCQYYHPYLESAALTLN